MPNLEKKEGLSLWNVGETPGDENASAMVEYFASIPNVSVSMNREALSERSGQFTNGISTNLSDKYV